MLALLALATAHATELHGYFRVMARPDLVGGAGRLGDSTLHGRLLNEGPWGLLELEQPLVGAPGAGPWGDLRLRVEGGAVGNGDPTNGSLLGFRMSVLQLRAGGLGPADVTWRFGTLETTFGDLWLYDLRPTQLLVDVLGASASWDRGATELTVGVGDAGYALRGARYLPVPSGGAALTRRFGEHVELGLAGQAWLALPGRAADAAGGHGWKGAAHVGLRELGPLRAARLQVVGARRLPDGPNDAETAAAVAARTDGRYELLAGAEAELAWPGLELAWGALLEHRVDLDAPLAALTRGSTVVRAQVPVTGVVSLLGETSLAREGGAAPRDTWQGKVGVLLLPGGPGLGSRPALRLLYGAQYATVPDAWPGVPTGSRWHQLVSAEAEAWF